MAHSVSFEAVSRVDFEISVFELDAAGQAHFKAAVAPQGAIRVDSAHMISFIAKRGEEVISRYTALKKYPQWLIFGDENEPTSSGNTGSKALNHLIISADLYKYILAHSLREPPALKRCRDETLANPNVRAQMQTAPEEAQFLGVLVKAMKVTKAIEVGVFTGYSSIAIATNLPQDGKLVAFDINEEWTNFARGYWKQAAVDHKVDLRLGPGVDGLDALISQGDKEVGTYDFAFIDADKPNYANYFDRLMKLVRVGGMIMIDNVLWHGAVVKAEDESEATVAIRKLNADLFQRDDIDISMLGIGDGVTFAVRTR